jgi:glutamate 5-kinase
VVIVSSGAIALGRRHLGLPGRLRLEESQAAAAVGQIRLAHAWKEVLEAARPHRRAGAADAGGHGSAAAT